MSWTWRHLINRTDVWGGYRPLAQRGTTYTKKDGTGGTFGPTLTHPPLYDRGRKRLSPGRIYTHYLATAPEDVVGLHTTSAENTCRWGATESDVHAEGGTSPEIILAANSAWYTRLHDLGTTALMTDSNGKGGVHLRAFFSEPAPSELVYAFFRWLVSDHAMYGMDREPEVFPK